MGKLRFYSSVLDETLHANSKDETIKHLVNGHDTGRELGRFLKSRRGGEGRGEDRIEEERRGVKRRG